MTAVRSFFRDKAPGAIGAVLTILALVACSPSQSQDEQSAKPAPAASAAPAPASSTAAPASNASAATAPAADSDEAVIARVSEVIRKHQLSTLADACLDYIVDDSDGATVDIDVHEKHDAQCGGDPQTAPRLFSFKLDRASHQLSTDALDLADGDFQPIE